MADGDGDGDGGNSAGNGVVELEAMRKDTFSWHPCQVSLCSKGLGLIVLYGNNYSDEIITDKQEIEARIRMRSTPLQGDDCSSIKKGQHVLATQSSCVKGVFYDAWVEEAIHVRHSKRIHCRCSFMIKWLHQALQEEALTVPSSAIMKLATKSIHLHPTISTYFSMLESSNGLDTMPCSTIVDGMNWEMDINVLLEKQIKEISNSTDVHQAKIPEDLLFRQEVDLKVESDGSEIEASLKDPHVTIPSLNKLNGSNWSENKQPTETILEIPLASTPSAQEEFTGSRLFLSPLAARAALASLRSEFPRSPELSAQSNVEKGDISGGNGTANILYSSAVDHSSNTKDLSLKISATLGGKSPKSKSIVKTLFPTSGAPQMVESSDLSSGAQRNGMEKKKRIGVKKITQPSELRVTRSQIKRINGMQETTHTTNINETESRLAKARRVTRSAGQQADKIEPKEYNRAIKDNVHTEGNKLETSPQNIVAAQDFSSDNQKVVASPIGGETSICSDEDDKELSEKKDGMVIKVDVQKGTFTQNAGKQNYPRRLTRSAAREETEKSNVQPKLKLSKRNVSEANELNLVMGNVFAEGNSLKFENSLTLPLATKVTKQFTEEREKNRETLTYVKSTPKNSESGVCSRQGTRQKSAKSENQGIRFSHRLRFLPRTRSQNKAA